MSIETKPPKRRIRTTRMQACCDLIVNTLEGRAGSLEMLYGSLSSSFRRDEIDIALNVLERHGRLLYSVSKFNVSVCLAPPEDEARDEIRDAADDLRDWAKVLAAPAMALAERNMRQPIAEAFKARLIEAASLAEQLLDPPADSVDEFSNLG